MSATREDYRTATRELDFGCDDNNQTSCQSIGPDDTLYRSRSCMTQGSSETLETRNGKLMTENRMLRDTVERQRAMLSNLKGTATLAWQLGSDSSPVIADRATEHTQYPCIQSDHRQTTTSRLASLTCRQRQVLDLVLAGHPSKNIAADLCISQRTVDNHRAAIMRKSGSKSIPALVRIALAAV